MGPTDHPLPNPLPSRERGLERNKIHLLNIIQKELESIYQIACPAQVDEFLLSEENRSQYLKKIPWIAHSDEVLLIEQAEDEIHVGLLLNPKLIDWSKTFRWEDANLSQLNQIAPLIEGVSHFVYLLWRAEREQPVTQLELELQAEVDKFILFSRLTKSKEVEFLIPMLFSKISWLPNLHPTEQARYKIASRLASQYCQYLKTFYLVSHRQDQIYPEIRTFYRMSQLEKIRHIKI
jgi:hypothetical protein